MTVDHPIRALHLLGRRPDFQTERAVQALSRRESFGARLAEIRPGGTWRHLPGAAWGLRAAAKDFDLVHCWDDVALTAAALAGCKRIIFSPQTFPTRRSVSWLRAVGSYRQVQVVCPTATMHRYFAERGVPLDRLKIVRPGVDFSLVKPKRDPALRASLGLAADDYVLLAPGESTEAADHYRAVWTASVLGSLDSKCRLLMLGRGPRARRDAVLGRNLGQPNLVCLADERLGRRVGFEELVSAADALLVTATGPASTLPIAVCMAAAMPIVSTVTPTIAELLEDRHTALMVGAPKPRLLAAKMLTLREDATLRRQLSDTARTEAFEYLSLTKFLQAWREIYAEVAAEVSGAK